MNRIKIISNIFYYLLGVAILLIPVMLIYSWSGMPYPCADGQGFCSISVLGVDVRTQFEMTTMDKAIVIFIAFIPNGLIMLACYFMMQLFKAFHSEQVFTDRNVILLKRVSLSLLVFAIINPLSEAALAYALTWKNPPGEVLVAFGFSSYNLILLFLSGLVFSVSWVIAEANELKKDQEYTV